MQLNPSRSGQGRSSRGRMLTGRSSVGASVNVRVNAKTLRLWTLLLLVRVVRVVRVSLRLLHCLCR